MTLLYVYLAGFAIAGVWMGWDEKPATAAKLWVALAVVALWPIIIPFAACLTVGAMLRSAWK